MPKNGGALKRRSSLLLDFRVVAVNAEGTPFAEI